MRLKTNEILRFSGHMKRKFLLFLFLCTAISYTQGKGADPKSEKKVVVLDAGHGGKDTGALGKNAKEKDIVLSITLKVGAYIEKYLPQVEVIYTRKTDDFIPLYERARIANKNNADLFISIHANSNKSTRPTGTETFAMGLHKTQGNLEVAQKENSVIVYEEDYNVKYEGFDPKSSESYIIFSLMQNTYLDQSLRVASYVQDEFREKALRGDRGVKQAGFLVLWNTSMPSVLVETGFISNPTEEAYLMSDKGQEYLASAIYRAVKKYIQELQADDQYLVNSVNASNQNLDKTDNAPAITEKKDTLQFRIQITSSSRQIQPDHPVFKGYSDVYEYQENGMYKYAIGNFTDYQEVKNFQESIKQKFPGAFIVAFQHNKKIDIKKIYNH